MSKLVYAPVQTPVDGSVLVNHIWSRWYNDLVKYVNDIDPTGSSIITPSHGGTGISNADANTITVSYPYVLDGVLRLIARSTTPTHATGWAEIWLSSTDNIVYIQKDSGTTKIAESETDMTGF